MKASPYIELFKKQLPTIPFEIQEKISAPNPITLTPFHDKDAILCDPRLMIYQGDHSWTLNA